MRSKIHCGLFLIFKKCVEKSIFWQAPCYCVSYGVREYWLLKLLCCALHCVYLSLSELALNFCSSYHFLFVRNYSEKELTAHCRRYLANCSKHWECCTLHSTRQGRSCSGQFEKAGRKPVSLWLRSLRCDPVIKEMWCPSGGCVPMRNRKPSSGRLPTLPAEVGSSGGRRCAETLPRLSSPGILAGTLLSSNIWERRRGEKSNPKPKHPPTLQVEKYDGLAAERVVTVRSL